MLRLVKYLLFFLLSGIAVSCGEDDQEDTKFTPPGFVSGVQHLSKYKLTLYQKPEELTVGYNMFYLRFQDTVSNTDVLNAEVVIKPTAIDGLVAISPHEQVEVVESRRIYYCGLILPDVTNETTERFIAVSYTLSGDPVKYSVKFPVTVLTSNRMNQQSDYVLSLLDSDTYTNSYRQIEVAAFFRKGTYPSYPLKDLEPHFTLYNPSEVVADSLVGNVLGIPGHYSGRFNFNKAGYWTLSIDLRKDKKTITKADFYIQIK